MRLHTGNIWEPCLNTIVNENVRDATAMLLQIYCMALLARTPCDICIVVALAPSWMQLHLFCGKPLESQANLGSVLCNFNKRSHTSAGLLASPSDPNSPPIIACKEHTKYTGYCRNRQIKLLMS